MHMHILDCVEDYIHYRYMLVPYVGWIEINLPLCTPTNLKGIHVYIYTCTSDFGDNIRARGACFHGGVSFDFNSASYLKAPGSKYHITSARSEEKQEKK